MSILVWVSAQIHPTFMACCDPVWRWFRRCDPTGQACARRDDGAARLRSHRGAQVVVCVLFTFASVASERPPVVLIHGLGRTSRSMSWMARRLEEAGFRAVLFDYPSQDESFEQLLARLDPVWRDAARVGTVSAVTHSMGGVLLRLYAARHPEVTIGRVVMLAPPGEGSELADRLSGLKFGRRLLGLAGTQLGTSAESLYSQLGPVRFELGVIAGYRSLNPLSSAWIPGPDDGKVAVARTKVPGMKEWLVLPCSHTWIMFDQEVIRLTIRFLRQGTFDVVDGRAAP